MQPMRVAGEQQLREYSTYRSVAGTAEATTLPDDAADLVIAGQAFHWFDVARAAIEARRILRPGGWAALIWNDRQSTGSAFLAGYEALLRTHGIDYAKLLHRHIDEQAIAQFFAPAHADSRRVRQPARARARRSAGARRLGVVSAGTRRPATRRDAARAKCPIRHTR